MAARATASVTAQNTWSDPITCSGGVMVDVSISGTFVATVTAQFKLESDTTWRDVKTYTAPEEDVLRRANRGNWRIGVATGDFTSGTATLEIQAGNRE